LNWHKNILRALGLLVILAMVSCGKPKEEGSPIKTPQDPTKTSGDPEPIPTTTPTTTTGIPDLSRAAAINLLDKVTFQGLNDILSPWGESVLPPLVGDPKILLQVTNSRTISINGKVTVAFEDRFGFWGLTLDSFPGTGIHTATMMDVIFASDEIVLRTVGVLNGDTVTDAGIYYRLRNTSDSDNTHCRKQSNTTTTCHCELTTYTATPTTEDFSACYAPAGYGVNAYYPYSAKKVCTTSSPTITTTACSGDTNGYMSLTNAKVKKLGTFSGRYSNFATLPEGQ
jgi:hypothetical protein